MDHTIHCSLDQSYQFYLPDKKIYYLNIVFQLHHADQTEYRRFRVVMTRDGILRIEEKQETVRFPHVLA